MQSVVHASIDMFPDRGEKLEEEACPNHEEQAGL